MSDIVKEAKKRFERASSAYSSSRLLAVKDTRFALGDSENMWQWPDDVATERKNSKRVCLTVNMTAQHCNQIINNIRINRPAVKVSPADDGADKKTAEILGGLIRNIQASSASDDAHDTAAEHSVYGGEGYWRVVTEYESPKSFNQVIKIKTITNPRNVYIDPDCKELDKSDANWGFVFEDISREQFKREHPGIDPASWVEADGGWCTDETVRRAEYFYCEYVKDKACLLLDGSTVLRSELPGDFDPRAIVKERDTERREWKWCKLVGNHDKPLDERDWLGNFLPIMSVVGKEVNVDGEIVRKGIVRDLKDPARMVNYAFSETVQSLALQNKIPYIGAAEAIEGYEDEWKNAPTSNEGVLRFNAYDDQGQPLPKPERQQPAVMPAAQVQLLQLSTEQMRGASGQQNANFGIKSEAVSGVGIQRLKVQGETATFHFPDNLARALRYEAKVLIDLIQKYYDTKRVERILGLDGKEESAVLDPELEGAYQERQDHKGEIEKIFNPQVGQYDVTIDTGPSYQTQRQEAAANLNELAAKNPALMQIAGDLIMRAQDFPMADKLADRLAKAVPPQLQDDKPGQQNIPPQVKQQMTQMAQALQVTQQKLQEAESGKAEALIQAQGKQFQVETDAKVKIHQSQVDAQLAREDAERNAALVIERARIEAQAKIDAARIDVEGEKQIAEIRGYFELMKSKEQPETVEQ